MNNKIRVGLGFGVLAYGTGCFVLGLYIGPAAKVIDCPKVVWTQKPNFVDEFDLDEAEGILVEKNLATPFNGVMRSTTAERQFFTSISSGIYDGVEICTDLNGQIISVSSWVSGSERGVAYELNNDGRMVAFSLTIPDPIQQDDEIAYLGGKVTGVWKVGLDGKKIFHPRLVPFHLIDWRIGLNL